RAELLRRRNGRFELGERLRRLGALNWQGRQEGSQELRRMDEVVRDAEARWIGIPRDPWPGWQPDLPGDPSLRGRPVHRAVEVGGGECVLEAPRDLGRGGSLQLRIALPQQPKGVL